MTDSLLKSQAFKFKARVYTLTVLQLLEIDLAKFSIQLGEMVNKTPKFFDNIPVIIDCSGLGDLPLALNELCQIMREHNLIPVAVQGASPLIATLAQCHGLAVLHTSSTSERPLNEVAAVQTQPAETQTLVHHEVMKNKLITTPVRSGQQVVCKGGDLVITSPVSHGAELLADGNIHVYGALRGRALAGISGDRQARIFCHSLDAELVSIAGFYRLSDAIDPMTGPCQIFLQDEHIHIEPL